MFDVGISEIMVIAVVALIVLGPEKLPKTARTLGHLFGRLQRYVADVKMDINRELQLDELKKMQAEVTSAATQLESSVTAAASEIQTNVRAVESDLNTAAAGGAEASPAPAATPSELPVVSPAASPAATAAQEPPRQPSLPGFERG